MHRNRKLYYCPFWLESFEAGQEEKDEEPNLIDADETPVESKVVSTKLLECESCSFSTENKLDLIIHIAENLQTQSEQDLSYKDYIGSRTVSGKRMKCSKCPLITRHPEILRWHFKHCHGETPVIKIIRPTVKTIPRNQTYLQCLLCGFQRNNSGPMAVHLNNLHNIDLPFECDICHQKFAVEHHLSYHQLTHYNALGWSCHICQTMFKNKATLNKHLTTVHQRHVCQRCNLSFDTMKSLQKHLLDKHSTYICTVCKKLFRGQKSMNAHKRTVHYSGSGVRNSERVSKRSKGEDKRCGRRLKCKICNTVIVRHMNLRLHMDREHPEKLVPCTLCDRKFTNKVYMQFHVRNLHTGPIMYCDHCPYSARNRCSFVQHWRRLHLMPKIEVTEKIEELIDLIDPIFIQITHKIPTTRTYGNRKLLNKKVENVKPVDGDKSVNL